MSVVMCNNNQNGSEDHLKIPSLDSVECDDIACGKLPLERQVCTYFGNGRIVPSSTSNADIAAHKKIVVQHYLSCLASLTLKTDTVSVDLAIGGDTYHLPHVDKGILLLAQDRLSAIFRSPVIINLENGKHSKKPVSLIEPLSGQYNGTLAFGGRGGMQYEESPLNAGLNSLVAVYPQAAPLAAAVCVLIYVADKVFTRHHFASWERLLAYIEGIGFHTFTIKHNGAIIDKYTIDGRAPPADGDAVKVSLSGIGGAKKKKNPSMMKGNGAYAADSGMAFQGSGAYRSGIARKLRHTAVDLKPITDMLAKNLKKMDLVKTGLMAGVGKYTSQHQRTDSANINPNGFKTRDTVKQSSEKNVMEYEVLEKSAELYGPGVIGATIPTADNSVFVIEYLVTPSSFELTPYMSQIANTKEQYMLKAFVVNFYSRISDNNNSTTGQQPQIYMAYTRDVNADPPSNPMEMSAYSDSCDFPVSQKRASLGVECDPNQRRIEWKNCKRVSATTSLDLNEFVDGKIFVMFSGFPTSFNGINIGSLEIQARYRMVGKSLNAFMGFGLIQDRFVSGGGESVANGAFGTNILRDAYNSGICTVSKDGLIVFNNNFNGYVSTNFRVNGTSLGVGANINLATGPANTITTGNITKVNALYAVPTHVGATLISDTSDTMASEIQQFDSVSTQNYMHMGYFSIQRATTSLNTIQLPKILSGTVSQCFLEVRQFNAHTSNSRTLNVWVDSKGVLVSSVDF